MSDLSESQFLQMIDEILLQIEETLEDLDTSSDIDYETAGGVLTIIFENRSQIILNRQTPVRQLWMATRSGGYHFDYDADKELWIGDKNGEEFYSLLNQEATIQAGEPIDLRT